VDAAGTGAQGNTANNVEQTIKKSRRIGLNLRGIKYGQLTPVRLYSHGLQNAAPIGFGNSPNDPQHKSGRDPRIKATFSRSWISKIRGYVALIEAQGL
jgi:hypothetical protein